MIAGVLARDEARFARRKRVAAAGAGTKSPALERAPSPGLSGKRTYKGGPRLHAASTSAAPCVPLISIVRRRTTSSKLRRTQHGNGSGNAKKHRRVHRGVPA